MRTFLQTTAAPAEGAVLHLLWQGAVYHLHWFHVTVDENRCELRSRRPHGHAHDLYHAVLFTRGRNAFSLGDRETPCEPGTLALTGPGQPHDFGPTRPGELGYAELTFAWQTSAGVPLRLSWDGMLAALTGVSPAKLHLPSSQQLDGPETQQVRLNIEALLNCLEARTPLSAFYAGKALLDFLGLLLERLDRVAATTPASGAPRASLDARLHAIRRHIERCARNRLDAAALARMAGVSEGHFQRAFTRLFGVAPHQYQQRLRLQAAQVLLRSSTLSSKAIAAQVGYDDPVLFARQFHKYTGLPPMAWRRRAAG